MTVNTTVNKQSATGDGSTTAFDITDFKIQQATDVKVYVDGVLQSSGYTVVVNDPDDTDGGTVTFSSAPALDADILFVRVVPYTQLFDMQYEENISESDINNAFDKLVMMLQQVKEITDRCLKLNVISGVTELAGIDSLENLAGYIPVVNDDEDDFELLSPSTIANLVTAANGDVNGPATAVDGNFAAFDGNTGKLLKDANFSAPVVAGKSRQPIRVNSGGTGLETEEIALSDLEIAAGVIVPTRRAHTVSTAGGADDLDSMTATSLPDGFQVILFAADGTSDPVTIKDGTGNIATVDGADFVLDDSLKSIGFVYDLANTTWREFYRNTGSGGYTRVESSQKSVAINTTITHAHGFGAVPTRWGCYLLCITTDLGYAVNDKIDYWWEGDGTYNNFSGSNVDATNIEHRFCSSTLPYLVNSSRAFAAVTAAKWKAILWAEIDN